MRTANAEGLLIAQIETVAGLEHVERIAAVDGIDVLWIGHFDLTNSLGIPAEFDTPDVPGGGRARTRTPATDTARPPASW